MKRGAIFDMDGTLLDTEKYYTQGWIETADKFNVERKPALASAMSGSASTDMPAIMKRFYPNVDAKKYVEMVREFVKEKSAEEIKLMSGVKEMLDYFKSKNILMAVASSSLKSVVEQNLERTGIRDYFNVVIGGDEITNGKPAPDIFIKAAEGLNLSSKDCYIFEDSFNGIRAGHASGATTIMIPDQVQPSDEILSLCTVYKSLNHALKAIIEGKI